jgi:phage tail-like protein
MEKTIPPLPEILTTCRFYLELTLADSQIPGVDAYFMECKGFKRTQDVVEICEVMPRIWGNAKSGQMVRTKVPGNGKTNNITLRRGLTRSMTLWNWFEKVEQGDWRNQLKDGSLSIYNQHGDAEAIFQFQGAWPVSYMAADLNAGSTDIEIEEMELAVQAFKRTQ